ncbi:nucleotidyltransferase family protein [Brevundimonas sp.]|uniref:nucleotidyltransferase family protein n=1 Tax=Brevundimonas sp. TaxID=1871086 RepID=UPI002D4EF697|nr:nucleotidyltransferase family protein [Brevundimonas sp.]HYD28927.1 nucleotidyltransferase family protein [Brevundimonas sp.]
MSDLETRLADIVRADPGLMHVLATVRSLGLNDWRVFSGAVYQSVWNAVTGRSPGYGIRDYDLGYFDPDTSWDAEDAVIRRVAAAFEPPFRDMVEVRNQARVHLWFKNKFGEPYEALTGTDEALARFVAPAFAVGVRLEDDDTISVAAPFGLEDVFSLTIRPNPNRPLARGWAKATANATARWPELTIIEPEAV